MNKTYKVKGALWLFSQTSQANMTPDIPNMAPWTVAEKWGKLHGGQRRPVPLDIKQGRVILQLRSPGWVSSYSMFWSKTESTIFRVEYLSSIKRN